MKYISTRGQAPNLDFENATLAGLASDGGLYIPDKWPCLSIDEIRALQNKNYPELATAIIGLFVGQSVASEDLGRLVSNAYGNFSHDAIVPLKQLDDKLFFMELFHGPTLAFKDYALQMLGQFFQYFLKKNRRSCTIVGATSGDTGSAAIAGLRGLSAVNLFMLHPRGRVSEVQRRQMTTVQGENIHNLAVEGTFDDCQNLVKALFNDSEFRQRHSLSAVNSINWARIAAQVVYYFKAALVLGAPDREINFSVPTGNFGNVLAGYVAKQMGLPIRKLIIGSNRNDILTRFFETGVMEKTGVTPTLSPSMDIQISSNFERYLFELLAHDSDQLNHIMASFNESGKFTIDNSLLQKAQQSFGAYRMDDKQIKTDINQIYKSTGEIIDPHSIIGVSAAKNSAKNTAKNGLDPSLPTVAIGTAHPAKFPQAIKLATGIDVTLPARLRDLMNMEEKVENVDNNLESIKTRIDCFARIHEV